MLSSRIIVLALLSLCTVTVGHSATPATKPTTATTAAEKKPLTLPISQKWFITSAGTFNQNNWKPDNPLVKQPVHTPGKRAFRLATGQPGITHLQFGASKDGKELADLSQFEAFTFWLYTETPGQTITLQILHAADNLADPSPGRFIKFDIDEEGWKQYTIGFEEFETWAKSDWAKTLTLQFEIKNPEDMTPTKDHVVITELEAIER